MSGKVWTIEKTGKRYKALGLLAQVIGIGSLLLTACLAGRGWDMAAIIVGPPMFVTAVLLKLYVRVGIWWNHR